jgi:predicted ATPase/DNA-binding winged helix-turn-helix (wHTH) protein
MHSVSEASAGIAFGRFLLLPHRRELLADGRPVKLGGRAFDVLTALIEAHGAVVSKNALMARVWPDRIVEENNLQWQISALRAALGADRNLIRTVPGRGYQFTGAISAVSANPEADAGTAIAAAPPDPRPGRLDGGIPGELPPTNLPEPISELVGRDDVLGEILSLAAAHRLVTLTGAGGIGKTRLALAVAHRLLPQFADGVWLAEFSPIADPGLVPVTVAAAIGLDLGGGVVTAQRVSQSLAGRRLVLVLDTCEHVIGAAAALAEAVLRAGGTPRLLATSREPLRAEGEWVYPVPPLAVPAEDAEEADELLRYGGVRLFFERLRAAEPHFASDRGSAAMAAAICRRLDGIPLAIELAAARAAVLGVEEVATHLDDRFRILTGGRRTALPRHQTLRATLDWSYELLSEPERVILRRLAVFSGSFSLEPASTVIASSDLTASQVIDGLFSLIAKSLVAAEAEDVPRRYRLLDTTRAYALEKLDESGEREWLARRHAEYYRDLFERAEAELEITPRTEWLADYGWQIDNVRAALDWAYSPNGDASLGAALIAATVPLWMCLSLLEECRGRVEQALAALAAGADRDARRDMRLQAALGASLTFNRSTIPEIVAEIGAAWTKVLKLAESLDDAEYQLRSLWGLWFFHTASGRHPIALTLAQRFSILTAKRPEPLDRLVGEQMIGISQHYLGDQASARRHLECVLAHYISPVQRWSYITRFGIDLRVTVRVFLAWALWLQGFPDQAMRAAESGIADAWAANHAISLCYALAQGACPIALLVGDLAAAEHYAGMLLDHSTIHAPARWHTYGRIYQGVLAIKRDDTVAGLQLMGADLDEHDKARSRVLRTIALLTAESLGRAGKAADRRAAVEEALKWTADTDERWGIAELLRIKGELLLMQDAPGTAATAEDHFRQALDLAHRQGALSWELRAAASLARLLRDQGRSAQALSLLQPLYDRFTEGFDTADLKAVKAILDALQELGVGMATAGPCADRAGKI